MEYKNNLNCWKLAYGNHSVLRKNKWNLRTETEIRKSGCPVIDAKVPGNFELDLSRAGVLPEDLYFGTNILEVQKYESTHLWYFTNFILEDRDADTFLLFEGIDTASEIYVDGKLLGKTENMLIPHEFSLEELEPGEHELVVHIIPASVYCRNLPMQTKCNALLFNLDSVYIRKAPYMFGWDIMPRAISGGLWRPVSVVYRQRERINDYFVKVCDVSQERAKLEIHAKIHSDEDQIADYSVMVKGVCGESTFEARQILYSYETVVDVSVEQPQLWWPKNYGEPNLYKTEIFLMKEDEVIDRVVTHVGIRTIGLDRTATAGKNGRFHFQVNGKDIFVLGTNWVPTDVFPSRHDEYTLRALEMVNDIGCNMIRCWGGNVYPPQMFFDYCDRHGILVWQDFAMACAIYPTDERFCNLLRLEAESLVRRLRGHASLALWSGDNECDALYDSKVLCNGQIVHRQDPNDNILTRQLLPEVINRLDGTRPYLPSSPFLSPEVFPFYDSDGGSTVHPAEDHMWGPRDWFKGEFYYTQSVSHFVSETGYHGCPGPESLKKFIAEDRLENYGDEQVCDDTHWLLHATVANARPDCRYAFRIPLVTRQTTRLFGKMPENLENYALASQISQAEAVKFFVEHFRAEKWYRSGILWWNMIEGWPQISDAVVDWYGAKKLAYHYIKTSQQPFCMVCDEPDADGNLTLCATNDTRNDVAVHYTVTNTNTGVVVAEGNCVVGNDTTARIVKFPEDAAYYQICWEGSCAGKNHFIGKMGDCLDFEEYISFIKKFGYYDLLEGF